MDNEQQILLRKFLEEIPEDLRTVIERTVCGFENSYSGPLLNASLNLAIDKRYDTTKTISFILYQFITEYHVLMRENIEYRTNSLNPKLVISHHWKK